MENHPRCIIPEVLDYFDGVLAVLEEAVLTDPLLAHRIILSSQAHQSRVRTTYRRMLPTPPASRPMAISRHFELTAMQEHRRVPSGLPGIHCAVMSLLSRVLLGMERIAAVPSDSATARIFMTPL